MFFAKRPDIFPAQSGGNGQIRPQPEFILAKKTQVVVEREALRVSHVRNAINIPDIEVG